MLSNLSFDHSRFISNQAYTLPIIIPQGCNNAVIFSLKTKRVFDPKVFLWSPKKKEFMLNILFIWDDINDIFEKVTKSKIYNSNFFEIYCFTLKKTFIQQFKTTTESVFYGRLLLESVIEKVNKSQISQMNYLTKYEYLEYSEFPTFL